MRLLICTQAVDRDDPILGFFHRWIEEFAKHAEKVTVICLRKGNYNLPGIEVIALGERAKPIRAFELCAIALGRRSEYDSVFVHMNPEYLVAAGWLWKLMGKKTALWYAHKSASAILRAALPFTDVILSAAPGTFPIDDARLRVMGQGIDVDSFVPRAEAVEKRLSLVTIGRIAASKRLVEMAKGVASFLARNPEATLAIYGSANTDDERAYEKQLRTTMEQTSDRVMLKGGVSNTDVPDILKGATAFLTLGITGGMDKAVLEAMACEVPVIGSNAVFDGLLKQEGLFVEHADKLSEVLDGFMARDADARRDIGRRMRAFVENEHGLSGFVRKVRAALETQCV